MSRSIIVSPNRATRTNVRRAAEQSMLFKAVYDEDQLTTVQRSFESGATFHYVFIDSNFGELAVAQFIDAAKKTSSGRGASFILIAESDASARGNIASSMMAGCHAILTSPVSIGKIQDTVPLAAKVNGKGTQHRLRAATGLMLSEVMRDQEELEARPINLWNEVETSCDWYKKVTGESITISVVDPLRDIPAAERLKHYTGVSKRVRELLKERLKSIFLPSSS